jgi:hypothetical protein
VVQGLSDIAIRTKAPTVLHSPRKVQDRSVGQPLEVRRASIVSTTKLIVVARSDLILPLLYFVFLKV